MVKEPVCEELGDAKLECRSDDADPDGPGNTFLK